MTASGDFRRGASFDAIVVDPDAPAHRSTSTRAMARGGVPEVAHARGRPQHGRDLRAGEARLAPHSSSVDSESSSLL